MAERTLILVKPDAVQRHLAGQIISRFERKGLKIVAGRFMRVSEELAREHYAVHKGRDFYEPLVRYLMASPVLAMVWEGEHAIDIARNLMGPTFGPDAPPGTIRGDLSRSMRYNLVHGSDSPEAAEREIDLWFEPEQIVEYDLDDRFWYTGRK